MVIRAVSEQTPMVPAAVRLKIFRELHVSEHTNCQPEPKPDPRAGRQPARHPMKLFRTARMNSSLLFLHFHYLSFSALIPTISVSESSLEEPVVYLTPDFPDPKLKKTVITEYLCLWLLSAP